MPSIGGFIASIVLTASSQSFAADAMLFRAASFIPVANEASLLTIQERETIRLRREDRFTKQVMVVGFNSEALQASSISLEMPDQRVYRFNGVVMPGLGTPGYFTWKEAPTLSGSKNATPEAAEAAARGSRSLSTNSLQLFFDSSRTSVIGNLAIADRSFELVSLNSRYMALQENGLNPSSLPIDVEPPGPLFRPRRNADWPRGLLTEKLKESLATTSIGSWLSPEYCNRIATCGEVTRIACNGNTDGPDMYFNNVSGKLIMACGGACMRGPGLPDSKLCTACPPPEWRTCSRNGK